MILFLSGVALLMGVLYLFLMGCPGLKLRIYLGRSHCYIVQLLP